MIQNARPYGDNFIVGTPALNSLHDKLYQEQRQKQIQQQRDTAAMDDEFSRNLYKIRDADVNELTQLYQDWKNDTLKLQSKGNKVTPEDRANNLRKRAEIYRLGNESMSKKQWFETQSKQIPLDKKGTYADDAPQRMIFLSKIPTRRIDPNEETKLLYPYSVPDFDKHNRNAIGLDRPRKIYGEPIAKGLMDETPVYTIGNNPNEMYNSLFTDAVKDNKVKNTIGLVNHSFNSDAEKLDYLNRYNQKINDPAFIAVYGKPKPFTKSADPELDNAIMLQVAKNVVDAPMPTPMIERKVNADRKAAYDRNNLYIKDRLIRGRAKEIKGTQGLAGNDFDRVELGLPKIEGKFYTKDKSQKFTGNWTIYGLNLPKATLSTLKSWGINISSDEPYIADIQNGELQSIRTIPDEKGVSQKVADRVDMDNAQKHKNTESQKAPQPEFGDRIGQGKAKRYSLGKQTFTEDQVIKAAKQSGLSLQEYIKQFGLQ